MSIVRRIRRQGERNRRRGQIHAAGFKGRRKRQADRFLKQRAQLVAARTQATAASQKPLVSPRSHS